MELFNNFFDCFYSVAHTWSVLRLTVLIFFILLFFFFWKDRVCLIINIEKKIVFSSDKIEIQENFFFKQLFSYLLQSWRNVCGTPSASSQTDTATLERFNSMSEQEGIPHYLVSGCWVPTGVYGMIWYIDCILSDEFSRKCYLNYLITLYIILF